MNPVHHVFFKTPFGIAAIAYSEPPFRLQEVCLPRPGKKDLIACMKRAPFRDEMPHPLADEVVAGLEHYFRGGRCAIPWHVMETGHWTPAQREVYHLVARIPYGEVRAYGDIARQAGRPKAARFVGNCMASNPFPVLVPCHRVIARNGGLGGFGGGLSLKRKMLTLEGIESLRGAEPGHLE